jgi:cytochrome P450
VLNPSFSPAAIKSFDPLMKKSMDRIVQTVQKNADPRNGAIEMSQIFKHLAFDVWLFLA